ncbi:MAG: hypothetical protein KAX69_07795 [Chitinophagales bacterium]|jgi:hypothetical protein|nr:hypothetical protein [Chitinophagales bacterium]
MTTRLDFFITTMPDSRPADYYLGCLEGCVFLDFNNKEEKIALIRISFDGYGCCDLKENAIPLNDIDSEIFKNILQENINDQNIITQIVKKAIFLNKGNIWTDALKEYHLI